MEYWLVGLVISQLVSLMFILVLLLTRSDLVKDKEEWEKRYKASGEKVEYANRRHNQDRSIALAQLDIALNDSYDPRIGIERAIKQLETKYYY